VLFRSNGQPVGVTVNYGVSDLVDPAPQANDGSPGKVNFANKPLFSAAGPQFTDIDQGSDGDCYFLARLAAMAKTHPQYIRNMITEIGDGTYAVQFFNQDNERVYVRVDADLYMANGKTVYADLGNDNCLWVAMVEKAWAIFREGNASYGEIDGGHSETDTEQALGVKQQVFHSADYASGLLYVKALKQQLDHYKGVTMGGPAGMTDDTPLTDENFARSAHIYMVHSVVCNSQGVPTKVRLYNLYGGGLTEITNFAMLKFCTGAFAAAVPSAAWY